MDESSADPLIARLSSDLSESEFADCVSDLAAVPELAIRRIIGVLNGSTEMSAGNHPIETYNRRVVALAFLCSQNPDVALDLIEHQGVKTSLGVIQALGSSDDPRLRALASEAIKSGGV